MQELQTKIRKMFCNANHGTFSNSFYLSVPSKSDYLTVQKTCENEGWRLALCIFATTILFGFDGQGIFPRVSESGWLTEVNKNGDYFGVILFIGIVE